MPVRCGLQPQLALALSGIFSSFRGPSSAEPAVSRKVFLRTPIDWYAGCARTMPLFALLFLFFTLANCSLPGTSSFVGEFQGDISGATTDALA